MASNSFIPSSNKLFDNWQKNFVDVVNNNLSEWQLSAAALAEWTALTTGPDSKKKRWDDIWAVLSTRNFTRAQRVEMLEARKEYEFGHRDVATDSSLRIFITRYLRHNPLVSIQQKDQMGLTVPDMVKTTTSPDAAGAESQLYQGTVKWATHLLHHNKIWVPGHKSKAKGKGIEEIQIYVCIREAANLTPPDVKDFAYDGVVKRGRYNRFFEPSHEGKRAWYYVRLMLKGQSHVYGSPGIFWHAVIM